MRFLSQDEIKQRELSLLLGFSKFCDSNDLDYSLAGGTLLGAIRHKGFIPWDDDIDIKMSRNDYQKLIELRDFLKRESGFELIPYQRLDFECTPLVKLVDRQIAVKSESEKRPSFLWIDITADDALPADIKAVNSIYRRVRFWRKLLSVSVSTPESGHNALRRTIKRLVNPIMSSSAVENSCSRRIVSIAKRLPYGSTPYVGAITWGLYGPGERMKIEEYSRKVPVMFEGHEFSAVSCWDEYLTGLYGDYMKLPPVEKRISHDLIAWHTDDITLGK